MSGKLGGAFPLLDQTKDGEIVKQLNSANEIIIREWDQSTTLDGRIGLLTHFTKNISSLKERLVFDGVNPENIYRQLSDHRKRLLNERLKLQKKKGQNGGPHFLPCGSDSEYQDPLFRYLPQNFTKVPHNWKMELALSENKTIDQCPTVVGAIRCNTIRDLGHLLSQKVDCGSTGDITTTTISKYLGRIGFNGELFDNAEWWRPDKMDIWSHAWDYYYNMPIPDCDSRISYQFKVQAFCDYSVDSVDWAKINFDFMVAHSPTGFEGEGIDFYSTGNLMLVATPPAGGSYTNVKRERVEVQGSMQVSAGDQSQVAVFVAVKAFVLDGTVDIRNLSSFSVSEQFDASLPRGEIIYKIEPL